MRVSRSGSRECPPCSLEGFSPHLKELPHPVCAGQHPTDDSEGPPAQLSGSCPRQGHREEDRPGVICPVGVTEATRPRVTCELPSLTTGRNEGPEMTCGDGPAHAPRRPAAASLGEACRGPGRPERPRDTRHRSSTDVARMPRSGVRRLVSLLPGARVCRNDDI